MFIFSDLAAHLWRSSLRRSLLWLPTSSPRNVSLNCEPDPVHIDWLTVLTVTGATIRDLELAWLEDYHSQPRAMRIVLSAGIDDFVKGRSRKQVVESFMQFKNREQKPTILKLQTSW